MLDFKFIYPTPGGSQEIALNGEKISFGRGSEADQRFPDGGLSRLNSTVYRDGDKVWIVDENSSNGTFVNGTAVDVVGTPLNDGDRIKIGSETVLTFKIERGAQVAAAETVAPPPRAIQASASQPAAKAINFIPIILIAGAFLIVSLSVVFVAAMFLIDKTPVVTKDDGYTSEDTDERDSRKASNDDTNPTPIPTSGKTTESVGDNSVIEPDTQTATQNSGFVLPQGKKYLDLSDDDKNKFIGDRAMKIAQVIGNSKSEPIPPAAISNIKRFLTEYARTLSVKPRGGECRLHDSAAAMYERGSKNAPFIIRAFNEKGMDSRIGLYLAMIESEHCVCLQSGTGPLGMFQFTYSTAKAHFLPTENIIKNASPQNPDDRCNPEAAARASASYMKALSGRYGTGPASVPLAIGSYNSGEGGLSSNLVKALADNPSLPRDFWTMIANADKLSVQFQNENFKYVPKFFAAAIVGENPSDFGLNLQPLSTYSK